MKKHTKPYRGSTRIDALAAVFPVAQVGFQRETGIDHQMKSYLFLKTDASGVDSRLT